MWIHKVWYNRFLPNRGKAICIARKYINLKDENIEIINIVENLNCTTKMNYG